MQSEESHERSSKETSPSDMTIDIDEDSSSAKSRKQCNSRFSSEAEFPFDRLKLESYIEKVIPDSPQSSDTAIEDDSKLKEILSKAPVSWQDETSNNNYEPDTVVQVPFKNLQEESHNESIRSWLQKITQMQNEIQKKIQADPASFNNTRPYQQETSVKSAAYSSGSVPSKPSRIVTYDDLPYMGEMTLDNSKPRRGRKPKKADICHLIYKNYGTIFPGAPTEASREVLENEVGSKRRNVTSNVQKISHSMGTKNNVQNKIISSLLERRLTQETRKNDHFPLAPTINVDVSGGNQNEPLNLCIRDLNQLKIRMQRRRRRSSGGSYTSPEAVTPADNIKMEPQSDDEVEFVNESSSFSNHDISELKIPALSDLSVPIDVSGQNLKNPDGSAAPGGYIYWPNAGVFIHPIALQQQLMYYQRMAANSGYTLPSPRPPPDSPVGNLTAKSPNQLRKLAPKARPKSLDEQPTDHLINGDSKIKRNASTGPTERAPIKRKRSAIFIPPIPAENQTNPATEVSICKFKFTGGAKPSLQEKKMLSVDSGGNFRYYSGTGDKSMRGYEFFPRETLQQQVESAHGSSTGAFLQASGEKIYPTSPVDFGAQQPSHPDFILGSQEIHSPASSAPSLSSPGGNHTTNSNLTSDQNSTRHKSKRKSRKSLQREKLEQTFKEKGFLIQTQQLESAEGATYCKFRQLRKFTRYLFRSWKDYLPGNVRELQDEEEEGADGADPDSGVCGFSAAAGGGVLAAPPPGDLGGTV